MVKDVKNKTKKSFFSTFFYYPIIVSVCRETKRKPNRKEIPLFIHIYSRDDFDKSRWTSSSTTTLIIKIHHHQLYSWWINNNHHQPDWMNNDDIVRFWMNWKWKQKILIRHFFRVYEKIMKSFDWLPLPPLKKNHSPLSLVENSCFA